MRDARNIEGGIRMKITWRDRGALQFQLVGCGIALELIAGCRI